MMTFFAFSVSLRHWLCLLSLACLPAISACDPALLQGEEDQEAVLISGACLTFRYLPLLEGRRVGLIANHASMIGKRHLADSLLALGVDLRRIFAPEHGFRGLADAGEHIRDGRDTATGLPVISLYGSRRKPAAEDLQGLDILLFDLQDVGARFYTYISTLSLVMEAAAEQGLPLIVLDRPNPNGFYFDGPVLRQEYASFVGMHPVPVVYGMTIGEYACMVNGEYWLADSLQCDLQVVGLKNYDRERLYPLPQRPSPNLPGWQAVYLYPSLCFFEGTVVSVGRGTDFPFTLYGHPELKSGTYTFTPFPAPGAAHPPLEGHECHGFRLGDHAEKYREHEVHLKLTWLCDAYRELGMGEDFFNAYFDRLAGTDVLRQQIMDGFSPEAIRESWAGELKAFNKIRKKYLLYEDF